MPQIIADVQDKFLCTVASGTFSGVLHLWPLQLLRDETSTLDFDAFFSALLTYFIAVGTPISAHCCAWPGIHYATAVSAPHHHLEELVYDASLSREDSSQINEMARRTGEIADFQAVLRTMEEKMHKVSRWQGPLPAGCAQSEQAVRWLQIGMPMTCPADGVR
jgi:hypothetical protein